MPRRRYSDGVGEAQSFPTLAPSSSRVPSLGDIIAPHLADDQLRLQRRKSARDRDQLRQKILKNLGWG